MLARRVIQREWSINSAGLTLPECRGQDETGALIHQDQPEIVGAHNQ